MDGLHLQYRNDGAPRGPAQTLQVPSHAMALVVADIILDRGTAELHDGDRLVARIEKRGKTHSAFWHVG